MMESNDEKTKLLKNPVRCYNKNPDVEPGASIKIPLLARRTTRQKSNINVGILVLCFLLIGGVTIGFYLLTVQDRPWPINIPFDLIDRDVWEAQNISRGSEYLNETIHVLVMQTRGENCFLQIDCIQIVKDIQNKSIENDGIDIPFNFLIGEDGKTYEGRGWSHEHGFNEFSEFSDVPHRNITLTIGLIGNFTIKSPSLTQIHETKAFLTESIRRNKLNSEYKIYGIKNITESSMDGDNLFKHIEKFHKWKHIITVT